MKVSDGRLPSPPRIIVAASAASAFLLPPIALKLLPLPFAWIGLSWTFAGFVIAVAVSRQWRLLPFTAAWIALALPAGELILAAKSPPSIERSVVPALNQVDSVLGWRPKPSQSSRATAKFADTTIYDVQYSTDSTGHRVSPPNRGDRVEGCLLFFVDSFTFGEGVRDDETFPYQMGFMTRGRFRVVNLAVPGYGAEHMLAILQSSALAARIPCEPTHIFYAALPNHVHRVAGKPPFTQGPRYRLDSQGRPQYEGTILGRPASHASKWDRWRTRFVEQLAKSKIYSAWSRRPLPTSEADLLLYFSVVGEISRQCRVRWPQAEFHVISWDIHCFYANGQARFHRGLDSVGATLHFIDDILPGYSQDPQRFGLNRFDLHPTPEAHATVARYLVRNALGITPDPGP